MAEFHTSTSFKVLIVILVFSAGFLWGTRTIRDRIFPYSLLEGVVSNPEVSSQTGDVKRGKRVVYPFDPSDTKWARKVIDGGYILHFRHAQREKWNDVTAFDAYELANGIQAENSSFSRATCLTDQGKEEAKMIGQIFAMTGVKISEVISSPSCRARQTALLAFNRIDRISNSLLHRTAMMPAQHDIFARELRKLIEGLEVKDGENIILSGHGGTLKFDGDLVIDDDQTVDIDERDETGFIVLEKSGDKIIARHKFISLKNFANAVIEFTVN